MEVATHKWLKSLEVAFVSGFSHPLVNRVLDGLRRYFVKLGHRVVDSPGSDTDVILTSAPYGKPLDWREAVLFNLRRRFRLTHLPLVFTLVPVTLTALRESLTRLERALKRERPRVEDFAFEGLSPAAYQVLLEQGRRGGALLALERVVQAQAKSIRVLLVAGEEEPEEAYVFDLAGAHPRIPAEDDDFFYTDLVLRIATAASTHEVTGHVVVDTPIPQSTWQSLTTPAAMKRASYELGRRNFFTPMVRISDLVHVPVVEASISEQYSEGCFATWDTKLNALITTVTGSARPVSKYELGDDDLAVVVGVRPDGQGALVRHVEGKRNSPPSSEAVEMMEMDAPLPRVEIAPGLLVPVARSKLHGHRGVRSFDPRVVEFVPLDRPYYYYPVSCATDAQARAIKAAFTRSQTLNAPDDPRPVAFTVLPCHGVVLVEKWVPGYEPLQVLWEAIDSGALEIDTLVPQGPLSYRPAAGGRMVLVEGVLG